VMQFSALVLLLCVVAEARPTQRLLWLRLAAATAGVAASTKYPAALLLVPVLLTAWRERNEANGDRPFGRHAAGLCLLSFAAYLAVTPGTILQPTYFLGDFLAQLGTYRSGHVGHTIAPGLPHLWQMLRYLALVGFSHFRLAAAAAFALAVAGAAAVARAKARPTALLATPVVFVVFLALFHVMIVRNTMLLFPYLAVLAATGFAETARQLPGRWARACAGVAVAAMLLANALWLVAAAGTIRDRGTSRAFSELETYLTAHPAAKFFLSERVRDHLAARSAAPRENVVASPGRADFVVFYHFKDTELMTFKLWPANRDRQFTAWFGPHEINLDYYPNWRGDDHIVVMTKEAAAAAGIRAIH